MENEILPVGKAYEPDEGARNPMGDQSSRRLITFADDTDLSEKSSSQKSYKNVLSQPAPSLSHRQRLLWLQKRRTSGLWVQCDDCDRWRYLADVLDSHQLPDKWYCRMNPDTSNADCSVPESPIRLREEEDLIHSIYSAGSVVWARVPGWPWWPAMVDDCPDTEQFYWLDGFSDIPTHYNVVFFDTEVTRAWIAPDNLKPYGPNKNAFKMHIDKKYKPRLQSAMSEADEACKLSLSERLEINSFIAKYKGNLNSPKKITKKDLIRHQKKMKRRFNVEFPIEVPDSENECEPVQKSPALKRNVIILGTPKRDKAKNIQDSLNIIVDDATFVQNSTNDTTPALPGHREKAKKRIQDSMDIENKNTNIKAPVFKAKDKTKKRIKTTKGMEEGGTESGPTDQTNEFKQPNSMVPQVGSTTDTVLETESYDDDTSKTYVPESRQAESTDNETEMETQEFEMRASTPNSDDFDF